MIKFYHVHKAYNGGSFALVDINLTIQDGEFLFLVGPSGAGKSTLMKLIYMEELPTSGVVTVGGTPYRFIIGSGGSSVTSTSPVAGQRSILNLKGTRSRLYWSYGAD